MHHVLQVTSFGAINYAALVIYLVGMLFVGLWAGRHVHNTRDFFLAGGKLNYVAVGMSILGTYLSALTMMALPAMSFGKYDWTYTVQLPFLIFTAYVITRFVLPKYRDAGVTSIYEYLEKRVHVSVRLVASLSFVIYSIGRTGLVLYLPALAFSTVTGVDLKLTIIVMGIVITLYTVIGGMEAVVWTDVIQVVIFVMGAFLTLGYILSGVDLHTFFHVANAHHKFRMMIPSVEVYKITTVWLILETIFQTIRIYGTQQDIAQRYMTTPSTKKAVRSVWIGIVSYIPLGFLFYFIGTALFVFYNVHPDPNVNALLAMKKGSDAILPYFVVTHLPVGIAGLVIAAIFAAAMSSIDSGLNAAATVCVEDFIKRFRRRSMSEKTTLLAARALTIMWGLIAICVALLCVNIQYAQITWGKIMGICTNGVLALLVLALLPKRINKWAVLIGFVASYEVLFWAMSDNMASFFWPMVSSPLTSPLVWFFWLNAPRIIFLLWVVLGNLTCFLVAIILDALFSLGEKRMEPRSS